MARRSFGLRDAYLEPWTCDCSARRRRRRGRSGGAHRSHRAGHGLAALRAGNAARCPRREHRLRRVRHPPLSGRWAVGQLGRRHLLSGPLLACTRAAAQPRPRHRCEGLPGPPGQPGGPDDPAEIQAAAPRLLRELVADAGPDLERRPEAGEWSVLDCIAHMIDAEMVVSGRYRWILAHDQPGDRWLRPGPVGESAPPASRVLRRADHRCSRRCGPPTSPVGEDAAELIATGSACIASAGRRVTGYLHADCRPRPLPSGPGTSCAGGDQDLRIHAQPRLRSSWYSIPRQRTRFRSAERPIPEDAMSDALAPLGGRLRCADGRLARCSRSDECSRRDRPPTSPSATWP